MKVTPHKILKLVYILIGIFLVLTYALSLIFKDLKDGKIDIEGIVDEEIEIIKSIPNFDFSIPVLGNGNISNGNITISIPFINKGIMFNQSDLETFRQLLTK